MEKVLYYQFHTIKISVETNSLIAKHYFDEFLLLNSTEEAKDNDIVIEFFENENLDKFIDEIPKDATLLSTSEEDLNGIRIYDRYNRGDFERWNIALGLGGVYIDIKKKYIRAIYIGKITIEDILPFLLFCNNPLLTLIRRCGFPLLHAACININGKYVLITGLSGRGKSTATFSLIQRGHIALTDEATLIKNANGHFNAYSVSGWIKVGENAKERFFPNFEKSFIKCGHDYIYKLNDINSRNIDKDDTKIEYIFILEQTGLLNTKIEPVGTLEVVKELFPVALSFIDEDYARSSLNIFGELMESVKLRKIYFGTDMEVFVDEIEKEIG